MGFLLSFLPPTNIKFLYVLILVELIFSHRVRWSNYSFKETMSAWVVRGIEENIFFLMVLISSHPWKWFYDHRQFDVPANNQISTYVFHFVVFEFVFYWVHRWSHENPFGWAYHAPHHTSERLNLLSVRPGTLRLLSFYSLASFLIMYIGFQPLLFFTYYITFSTFYQYIMHTELVPKLGPLELVFVTPSNHRVHHATQAVYHAKNYGATLIVFDKLFGTYQEELAEVKPLYGLVGGLPSKNPIRHAFIGWEQLFLKIIKSKVLSQVWKITEFTKLSR